MGKTAIVDLYIVGLLPSQWLQQFHRVGLDSSQQFHPVYHQPQHLLCGFQPLPASHSGYLCTIGLSSACGVLSFAWHKFNCLTCHLWLDLERKSIKNRNHFAHCDMRHVVCVDQTPGSPRHGHAKRANGPAVQIRKAQVFETLHAQVKVLELHTASGHTMQEAD
jgi:hypothetical protein